MFRVTREKPMLIIRNNSSSEIVCLNTGSGVAKNVAVEMCFKNAVSVSDFICNLPRKYECHKSLYNRNTFILKVPKLHQQFHPGKLQIPEEIRVTNLSTNNALVSIGVSSDEVVGLLDPSDASENSGAGEDIR